MPRIVNGVEITEENRFSVFVDHKDELGLNDLRNWIKSFTHAGVPATIAFNDKGYAVYRLGLTTVESED